ncbi:BglII/BstYI family type II restriction endonuclease [Mesorhizobium sp. M0771]|uniref:BglII/BstYI family type II restriction endonuclease n=1 Tax=Mesorhizobium sp. M0771 TaxID=2956997 RepID=UPI0033352552
MADDNDEIDSGELEQAFPDTSLSTKFADNQALVDARVPLDIRQKYEFFSYKNAVVVLSETRPDEWAELLQALRKFTLTKRIIRSAGGNESEVPKRINALLRPKGWHETIVRGDLHVTLLWKEQVGITKAGKPIFKPDAREDVRKGFIDGHKIDYVKNKVAFDLEWNSKDQTFDRDLYAFNAFYQAGAIDAGVLLTRSRELNDVFKAIGTTVDKNGDEIAGSKLPSKYGASTTWMGKLLYRLNAGRNGGCPVLAIGIRPGCIEDWSPPDGQG